MNDKTGHEPDLRTRPPGGPWTWIMLVAVLLIATVTWMEWSSKIDLQPTASTTPLTAHVPDSSPPADMKKH